MDTQITAYGIAGIGFTCGYVMFFALKRYLPPISNQLHRPQEIVLLVMSLTGGGFLGKQFVSLQGVNYVGPYGIGIFIGLITNIMVTLLTELLFHWLPQLISVFTQKSQ